jgi:hypothetical protein
MRIAEQEHREQSRVLWETLNRKLQARLGPDVVVTTRTLTGFEEGLYAWLAVAESRPDLRFGIAEMGGASTQVTFPCSACDAKDDAVRSIYVRGQPLAMYSYSFLGLGQDEAPKTIGQPAACAYGVGTVTPSWQPADCGNQMRLLTPAGLPDPFNYAGGQRGTSRDIPTERGDVKEWVLTGAFNFWDDGQIETCCRTRGQCFNEATACFRPIYFERYLQALRIPATGPRADVSWTLGSVICAETQCLRDATPAPVCQWSDKGCL